MSADRRTMPSCHRAFRFWIYWCTGGIIGNGGGNVLFRLLKFVWMCYTPFRPEGYQQRLQDACNGRGEERSPDAKEFRSRNEGCKRDNRMQPNGLAHDARPHHIPLDD